MRGEVLCCSGLCTLVFLHEVGAGFRDGDCIGVGSGLGARVGVRVAGGVGLDQILRPWSAAWIHMLLTMA